MRYISIDSAQPGMIVGKSIYNEQGSILVNYRVKLTERLISRMRDIGLVGLYIEDEMSSDITVEDLISDELGVKATKALTKLDGKLNLPLDLLEKAGPLSEEEYETMKTHSELGYERLKENINISSKTKMGVYMHHENVNGSGYPLGLRGDQIYMFAKIIHIADVYDAITSERPYKKAQSPKEAIEFLMNNAGKMFQPEYVKAFITYIPVYPKGRNVILSDGNVAVVVENRQYHTLYPVVRRLSDGETIDLAEQNENLSEPLSILDFER